MEIKVKSIFGKKISLKNLMIIDSKILKVGGAEFSKNFQNIMIESRQSLVEVFVVFLKFKLLAVLSIKL